MKNLYMKCCMAICVLLVAVMSAYAQTSVTGTVTDANGPVASVTVQVQGTSRGTQTDAGGHYSIEASAGETLQFSALGYVTQSITVGTSNTISITLEASSGELGEVVVTAFGIKREKRAVGYATQTVSGSDLTITQPSSIAQGLPGKVAGLNISQASGGVEGGSSRLVIRGNTSLTGDNRALIIVDGVAINNDPVNNNANNGGGGAVGTQLGADVSGYNDWGTGLNFINPEDVEDITVLKGPAAAALYGARGANGVILITRKKGTNRKGLGVDYSYSFRGTNAYEFLDFQNEYGSGSVAAMWTADNDKMFPTNAAGQRVQISLDNGYNFAAGDYTTSAYGKFPYDNTTDYYNLLSFPSGLSWGPRFDDQPILWYDGVLRPYSAQPDNWKAFFPNGSVGQHNVAISGGGDFGTARFSYTRSDNKANILNSNFNNNTFNLGTTIKVSKRVTAEITGSYTSYERLNTPPVGAGHFLAGFSYAVPRDYRSDVEELNNFAPDGSRRDVTNSSNFPTGSPRYPYYGYMANSFWRQYKNNTTFARDQFIGGAKIMADVTDWLTLTAQGGLDNSADNTEIKNYPTNVAGTQDGYYGQAMAKSFNRNLNAYARLHKDNLFDQAISGSLTAGTEAYHRNDYTVANKTNGNFVKPFIFALNNGVNPPTAGEEIRYGKKINSIYGFLDLSYNDNLFLQVTGRNDWSSTLADAYNSYFYPSANLSYVFSDGIKGMQTAAPWLNFGKLTLSYAETGSDTDPYTIYDIITTEAYNGQAAQTYPNTLKFPGIQPQRSRAYELGLSLGFLQNRLSVELTAYTMKSSNQILTNALPISSGFNNIQINRGSLGNKGFEFIINARAIQTPEFSWHISVNGATSSTTVLALDEGIDDLTLGTFFGGSGVSQRVKVGEKYGTIYGKDYLYYNGIKIVEDVVNPDSKLPLTYTVDGKTYTAGTRWATTGSEVPIGNALPVLTGGISNTFSYKGLSLYAMIDAKIGGDTYFGTYASAMGNGLLKETLKERNGGGLPLVYPDGSTANTGVHFDGEYAIYDENGVITGTLPNTNIVNYQWYYLNTFTSWNNLGHIPRSASVFENTWVKLREVALTYQIPPNFVQKTGFLQNLSVSLIGRDLFYIYTSIPKGLNPEGVNGIGNMQGIEYSSVPRARSFGFSIKTSL